MIICPVKKTRWGILKNKADLVSIIRTYGQFFGVDQSGPACNYDPSYPCDQSLYQYMGWGPHKGIDIPLNEGEEIFAVEDGKVVRISDSITQGLGIVIRHPNLETVYWHNKQNLVTLGQEVKKGELIAYADSTGYSTGHHLHFETRKTDDNGNFVEYLDPLSLISFENEMLDKEDVKFLQALEGFHDEAGVDFWGDGTHTLKQYKEARVPDKIKELTNLNG